jgi:hypothetical protein
MDIVVLGIDLGKNSCSLAGLDASGDLRPFFHPGMSRVGWSFELAPNLGPLSAGKSSFTG